MEEGGCYGKLLNRTRILAGKDFPLDHYQMKPSVAQANEWEAKGLELNTETKELPCKDRNWSEYSERIKLKCSLMWAKQS